MAVSHRPRARPERVVTPRWAWSFQASPAADVPPSPAFTSRYDAEEWLGSHWRDLAVAGVSEAVLMRDGAPVTPVVPIPSH